jgi:8-oxo-dGTP diphosphatase
MRRDYPDRPFLGVGAVIIHDNRVLLVRRANPPLQGEWSIPGGLVETGETTRDAIVREVLEETGLQVEVTELVEVFERILRDEQSRVQYHYVLLDYQCRVRDGAAQAGSDVSELLWATMSELESFSVAPETCAVIRKAFDSAIAFRA